MTPPPDRELLPQAAARQLLERAGQIDSDSTSVDTLRAAAREAGISDAAFEAALVEMRSNLASLLENRISALDLKLAEISKAGNAPIVVEKVQVMPVPEKVRDDSDNKQFKAEEKSVEQLQKEIMQALIRLEQVEIDKD